MTRCACVDEADEYHVSLRVSLRNDFMGLCGGGLNCVERSEAASPTYGLFNYFVCACTRLAGGTNDHPGGEEKD